VEYVQNTEIDTSWYKDYLYSDSISPSGSWITYNDAWTIRVPFGVKTSIEGCYINNGILMGPSHVNGTNECVIRVGGS
jgi:hypothetical protein